MELATVLIRVVLFARDMSFDFQPATFPWIFSMSSWKIKLLDAPKLRGMPKYLILAIEFLKLKISLTALIEVMEEFLLNWIEDLPR